MKSFHICTHAVITIGGPEQGTVAVERVPRQETVKYLRRYCDTVDSSTWDVVSAWVMSDAREIGDTYEVEDHASDTVASIVLV